MDGIDKIIGRIEADTTAQVAALIAQAKDEAAEISEKYRKAAEEEYNELRRAGIEECRLRAERLDSACEMEAKKSILALKQEMVASTFVRAKKYLRDLSAAQYTEFLTLMCLNAARTGREQVILNASDAKSPAARKAVKAANDRLLLERSLPGNLTLSAETREISGGLILKDGDIEVNCSIDALVDMSRPSLSATVAEILFD